ncbi:hypothetical protein L3Q82_001059 [Scortum barcoo]|uniref:Uncharacterized protein n=1 Tax=Scortum barcoo TaxID=214431 RepID=A0ACB8WB36_9TELE|nr:hypothetical protein L3Q82_001059 [Scortum barcoo]
MSLCATGAIWLREGAAAVPGGDAASQDLLYVSPVEAAEDPGVHVEPLLPAEEEKSLSGCFCDVVSVVSPGQRVNIRTGPWPLLVILGQQSQLIQCLPCLQPPTGSSDPSPPACLLKARFQPVQAMGFSLSPKPASRVSSLSSLFPSLPLKPGFQPVSSGLLVAFQPGFQPVSKPAGFQPVSKPAGFQPVGFQPACLQASGFPACLQASGFPACLQASLAGFQPVPACLSPASKWVSSLPPRKFQPASQRVSSPPGFSACTQASTRASRFSSLHPGFSASQPSSLRPPSLPEPGSGVPALPASLQCPSLPVPPRAPSEPPSASQCPSPWSLPVPQSGASQPPREPPSAPVPQRRSLPVPQSPREPPSGASQCPETGASQCPSLPPSAPETEPAPQPPSAPETEPPSAPETEPPSAPEKASEWPFFQLLGLLPPSEELSSLHGSAPRDLGFSLPSPNSAASLSAFPALPLRLSPAGPSFPLLLPALPWPSIVAFANPSSTPEIRAPAGLPTPPKYLPPTSGASSRFGRPPPPSASSRRRRRQSSLPSRRPPKEVRRCRRRPGLPPRRRREPASRVGLRASRVSPASCLAAASASVCPPPAFGLANGGLRGLRRASHWPRPRVPVLAGLASSRPARSPGLRFSAHAAPPEASLRRPPNAVATPASQLSPAYAADVPPPPGSVAPQLLKIMESLNIYSSMTTAQNLSVERTM